MQQPHDDIPSRHWADTAADELIALHPQQTEFTCASGISPSGMVHIGNFREVITVDFVVRALQDRGKKTRFLYSWDDYDAFRKVPANLPEQAMLTENLRRPISAIPDPFGDCPSYASHFEKLFEKEIAQLGIQPNFVYQNEKYRAGTYAKGIREALENKDKIVAVLNRYRTEPLPADWTPITVYCPKCNKDACTKLQYTPPTQVAFFCKECKETGSLDFAKQAGVKLLWRVDWPMRWAHEQVDFEPGGKDHSSQGGSYETGKELARDIWKREAPFYVQYDFVLAKGLGSKLSSSSGNLITLGEALKIYEPSVIRWIFASRKPNIDFSIAFDLDVMKAYDDFDRCERFAYGLEPGEEKKLTYEKRIYELSVVERKPLAAKLPTQFPFRHLCNILQIYEGDLERAKEYFAVSDADDARFRSRAARAWTWITQFAPEEFRFALKTEKSTFSPSRYPQVLSETIELLRSGKLESLPEEDIANEMYAVMKKHGLDAKKFFPEIYQALIGKNNGPRLASFLLAIGMKRAADLLEKSVS